MSTVVATELLERTVYMPGHDPITSVDYRPSDRDIAMMELCLSEARKSLALHHPPVGAVLLDPHTDEYWAAHSVDKITGNELDHAELRAYQAAQPSVRKGLARCVLYSTLETCIMCSSVYAQGKIGQIVVAASRKDAGLNGIQRPRSLSSSTIFSDSHINLTVVAGLLRSSSVELFERYVELRKKAAE